LNLRRADFELANHAALDLYNNSLALAVESAGEIAGRDDWWRRFANLQQALRADRERRWAWQQALRCYEQACKDCH
jgi:hypothetical protein